MSLSAAELLLVAGFVLGLSILVFLKLNLARTVLFGLAVSAYLGIGFVLTGAGASAVRILFLAMAVLYCLIFCQQFSTEQRAWWKGLIGFLPVFLAFVLWWSFGAVGLLPAFLDAQFILLSLILPVSSVVYHFIDHNFLGQEIG
ncbi:MAG: hypothetical protein AB7O96_15125 [Pseudobdellovibrionaceae bacterium]